MAYEINPEDVRISTVITGSGWFPSFRGVELYHTPSCISVTSTEERSQHANRAKAWEKLTAAVQAWAADKNQVIETRRQVAAWMDSLAKDGTVAKSGSPSRVAFERWYRGSHTTVNLHRSKKGYSSETTRVAWRAWQASVEPAQDRIFDLLLGDDGQAYKEARRYLEAYRPDLARKLEGL
jgi:hypothetical protein